MTYKKLSPGGRILEAYRLIDGQLVDVTEELRAEQKVKAKADEEKRLERKIARAKRDLKYKKKMLQAYANQKYIK